MKTLQNNCPNFIASQLPVIRERMSKYSSNFETSADFIDFILTIIPDTVFLNEPQGLNRKYIDLKNGVESITKDIWNTQSSSWSHTESLPNYFIGMTLIQEWFKYTDNPKDLLSIGCGPGLYEIYLEKTKKFGSLLCTDLSGNMLVEVRENQRRLKKKFGAKSLIKFKECSVEKMPFEDQIADVIICNKVLHWCIMQQNALTEMYRLLRSNGLLMLIFSESAVIAGDGGMEMRLTKPIDIRGLCEFLENKLGGKVLDFHQILFPAPFGQHEGGIKDFGILFKKIQL